MNRAEGIKDLKTPQNWNSLGVQRKELEVVEGGNSMRAGGCQESLTKRPII